MTGPEDFPATDVLRWEQSTVDKAFAEMVMGEDNARNAADWKQRLADIEAVTGCELQVVVVEEELPVGLWGWLVVGAVSAGLWYGIISGLLWLVRR
jgi:hypothetical protein